MNSMSSAMTSSLLRFSPCWFSHWLQRSLPSMATFEPFSRNRESDSPR